MSNQATVCEYCKLGSKPWLNGNGYWMHEGGVCCQVKNCVCHQGSGPEGRHLKGCGNK
jgi:hypothetical protein